MGSATAVEYFESRKDAPTMETGYYPNARAKGVKCGPMATFIAVVSPVTGCTGRESFSHAEGSTMDHLRTVLKKA